MTSSSLLLAILSQPSARADDWSDGTLLHGASEAEMKVTDGDVDHAGPDDGGAELYPWNLALRQF